MNWLARNIMLVRIAVILCLLGGGVAFADGGAIPPSLSLSAMMVLLGCTAASYALRKFTPASGFLHTPLGAVAIAALSASLTSIVTVVQTQGLNGPAMAQAAMAAVMSLLATSNPSQDGAK